MKKVGIIIGTVIILIVITVFSLNLFKGSKTHDKVSLIDTTVLNRLDRISDNTIDTSHLAESLVPPTNSWFSGIALQEEPKTVFPTPLAFTPSETGFSYGLTGVVDTSDSIIANHTRDVSITISDATRYQVSRYDELSVTLTYYDKSDTAIAKTTVTAGSPYIYVQPLQKQVSFKTSQAFTNKNGIATYSVDGATYAFSGVKAAQNDMPVDTLVTFYAGSDERTIKVLSDYALNNIESVSVAYLREKEKFITSLDVKTSNGNPTILGMLPHQSAQSTSQEFSIDGIYGEQKFYKDVKFTFDTPYIKAENTLDIDTITSRQKEQLSTLLRQEVNATKYVGVDTYYSGKELYRSAQLLQLASQLKDDRITETIKSKLRKELETWFSAAGSRTEKVFTYDPELHTVVGLQASFGSNDSNDHHFHYGYFIYAASILAEHDQQFVNEYGSMVNLLVADIANYNSDEQLPLRRSFDAYFGHSWASGSSPFNDGNNQESSSEAINAWLGISFWADIKGNQDLKDQADWMLSQETASMQQYWLNDARIIGAGNYKHEIVSLNWGGKRDYATFFSADPAAKLGILLIPLAPSFIQENVLLRDRINPQLNEAQPIDDSVYNFSDYLLMYKSLTDSSNSIQDVLAMDPSKIDSANSRSYMYAWVIAASK
jgi:endo-1,3(4)-beta-glucanase